MSEDQDNPLLHQDQNNPLLQVSRLAAQLRDVGEPAAAAVTSLLSQARALSGSDTEFDASVVVWREAIDDIAHLLETEALRLRFAIE